MSNILYKIFVDCHAFDGTFQGSTTYIRGVYTELIKDKRFHFFLASNDSSLLITIFGLHDNVTYLQYRFSNKYLRLFFNIPYLIKKNKIDFAHFQYVVPPIKFCKYIVTIHDVLFIDYPEYFPWSYRIKNRILFKQSAKLSEIILTVSNFSKQKIINHFRIKNVKVTTNAIAPKFFENYDVKLAKEKVFNRYNIQKYWIYVSRWEPRKNHHSLLRVFVENKYYKDYYLILVGNTSIKNKNYDKYYKSLSKEVKNKIISMQMISSEEMISLVRAADLSIYPSFAEGFGIPPLEALAIGIPTICSNTTAMSDFRFMENMTFNPYDLQDVKKCIDNNINSRPKESTRELLFKKYNWKIPAKLLKDEIINISLL